MAPFALILLGVVLYVLNQQPGVHVGFRGLPWLDAPTALVLAGALAGVVQVERARRRKARSRGSGRERRGRGEGKSVRTGGGSGS